MACLPRITRPGFSASTRALRILATARGSTGASVLIRMPRSAPIASAVRMVSDACCGPTETATISVALPASFSRIASSTAISSNGFIDILTLASSTPEPSALTRTFTLKSTTRLTGTRTFMPIHSRARRANYGPPQSLSTQRAPTRSPPPGGLRKHGFRGDHVARPDAFEQRHIRPPEHQRQPCPGDKPADMRPPGGVAAGRIEHVPHLHQRPETQHPGRPDRDRDEAE